MENAETKSYTLRELSAEDMFTMIRIIKKVGLKEIIGCFSKPEIIAAASSGGKVEEIGFDALMRIVEVLVDNIESIKDDLYAFLSQLSGKNREEVAALPMNTFIHMIMDVVKMVNFKDFFPAASKQSKSAT